jgi:hypothetical protein
VTLVSPTDPLAVFFALAVAHAVADFPLQGDYLARQKTRSTSGSRSEWLVALTAHSLIHAGAVWLVTGSMILGAAELVLHSLIDLGKGERKFGLVTDQVLHLSCKAIYVLLLTSGMVA